MRTSLIVAAVALSATVHAPSARPSPAPAAVTVRSSDYGRILIDGRGFALYAFTRDRTGQVLCQNVREVGGRWLVSRPNGTPV